MLGITSALAAEFVTGVGLREQLLDAPAPILFSFAIIAIASYVPILKGFTRCASCCVSELRTIAKLLPAAKACSALCKVFNMYVQGWVVCTGIIHATWDLWMHKS